MKYILRKTTYIMITTITTLLLFSCVSAQIHGNNQIQRATSAARLLTSGKISDAYIKQFNKEMDKALSEIDTTLYRIETDPEAYETVADSIQDWITLYDEIYILERTYPAGLTGKKRIAYFEFKDFRPLKEKAEKLAAESQYNKALEIINTAQSASQKIRALDHLTKAKSYSSHLNTEINELGASISYEAADELSQSYNSGDLKQAHQLYLDTKIWLPDYLDAQKKAQDLLPKIARALISDGDEQVKKSSYSSLRKAYAIYNEASSYDYMLSENKIADTKKKLTIKIGILFSGRHSEFPNSNTIKEALAHRIEKNNNGPMFAETAFVYVPSSEYIFEFFINSLTSLFTDFSNNSLNTMYNDFDIIVMPGENFNKVIEKIESPIRSEEPIVKYYRLIETEQNGTQKIEVSKKEYENQLQNSETEASNGSYLTETGLLIHDTQQVELSVDYSYDVYDIRNNNTFLTKLERKTDPTVYTFTKTSFSGPSFMKPVDMKSDDFYVSGKYKQLNLFINGFDNPYQIIDISYTSLDQNGQKLCDGIEKLVYKAKQ